MTINYKMYADLGKNVTRKYKIQHCISMHSMECSLLSKQGWCNQN